MISADAFVEQIQQGRKIEAHDDMSDEYREALINLMTQQADSELSGAYGYIPWIAKAPNIHEKLLVAQIVKDEMNHAYRMNKLLADLGIEVDARVESMDLAMRLDDPNADIGSARQSDDKRVNIFYYTIDSWLDFIMFNFCMDRGAGHQLEDTKACSYAPWARTIEGIFKEEMMHVNHGDTWVKQLAANPETRADVQAALNKWYPRTMNIFGRPQSRKNELYRKLGLKQRDNDTVRQAFKADIVQSIAGTGLTLPDWQPDVAQSA